MQNDEQLNQGIKAVVLAGKGFQQRTHLSYGFPAECDTPFGMAEKLSYANHLVLIEESVGQQVGMKLDGNFMDVFRYIAIVFPSVLQVGIGHQYQFLFVYLLNRVTHNALCSFGVLNEIQFTLGMYMDRKIKVRFLALYQNETILG